MIISNISLSYFEDDLFQLFLTAPLHLVVWGKEGESKKIRHFVSLRQHITFNFSGVPLNRL